MADFEGGSRPDRFKIDFDDVASFGRGTSAKYSRFGTPKISTCHEKSNYKIDDRIRDLTIRYEERYRLLLNYLDNLKRQYQYYSQYTYSLRKINKSLQYELSILYSKLNQLNYKDLYVLANRIEELYQYRKALQTELDERRMEISRSRVQTEASGKNMTEIIELKKHIAVLGDYLSSLEENVRKYTENANKYRDKLAEVEKQAAHLVVENCDLKKKILIMEERTRANDIRMAERYADPSRLTDLQAKYRNLYQENQNYTYYAVGSRTNSPMTHALLSKNIFRRSNIRQRVKTEADVDMPSRKRSTFRPESGWYPMTREKETLNEAIVKRCKLALTPH